jgi:hypothetical protein
MPEGQKLELPEYVKSLNRAFVDMPTPPQMTAERIASGREQYEAA